jgi:(5-formylfuran-3-yl)methyl phosphate transaminase
MLARSVEAVSPFLAMEIMERAQELERAAIDVVHLEVGEPDFDVPECVARAAEAATRGGQTHYTHSLGLRELREEIAAYYDRRCGVTVSPERVLVTTGSSAGLLLLMALLLDPGSEILVPDPGYACYPNFVRSFHGEPRLFPVSEEAGYRYDPAVIRSLIGPETRGLMVNSPANPTAAVQSRETLAELAGLGVPVISDEIYHGLEYGTERAHSMLELTDRCFVLDGFSKRYAMTGWRIGWLVAPEEYLPALQRLQQNLFICAGSVAQHAALAALRDADGDVERMRREYGIRREALVRGLRSLGFGVPVEPAGAYYVLADARDLDHSSLRLARRILEEAHVGVTPGIDFGSRAEGHLRFSFASALPRIEEGLRRLERWLATRA